MAGALIENEQLQRYVSEAMGAKPAGEIEARAGALAQTPEMQRQAAELQLRQGARRTKGAMRLALQDQGVAAIAGPPTPNAKEGIWGRFKRETFEAGSKLGELMSSEDPGELITQEARKPVQMRSVGEVAKSAQADLAGIFGRIFGPDAQRQQAAATADALGQKVLKVQLVAPASPVPMSGGGEQG